MTVKLHVQERKERGKQLKKLREAGRLPAVVYGPKEESKALTLDKATFEKTLKEGVESTIITLTGLTEDTEVLLHEVAFDPAKGGPTHVDFYAIERGKELTTDVPLEYVGEAPAVKQGGSLTKVLHEIEVTCRPSVLPQQIEVDVSVLENFEAQIQIKDLKVPEGVKVENDPEDVVALVQEVVEEVDETPEEIDMDAIEVEERGKDEGETSDAPEEGGTKEE